MQLCFLHVLKVATKLPASFSHHFCLLFSFSLSHAPWTNSTAKQWSVYVCAFISVTQNTSSKISSCIFDAEAVLKRLMGFQSRQLLKLYSHPQRSQVSLFLFFSCSPTVTFFLYASKRFLSHLPALENSFFTIAGCAPFFVNVVLFVAFLFFSRFRIRLFLCVCSAPERAAAHKTKSNASSYVLLSVSLLFFSVFSNLC